MTRDTQVAILIALPGVMLLSGMLLALLGEGVHRVWRWSRSRATR